MRKHRRARAVLAFLLLSPAGLTVGHQPAAGTPHGTPGTAGTVSAAPAPAAPAASRPAPAPKRESCDEGGWDGGTPAQIAPGQRKYNPEHGGVRAQMWQWHVGREDTYAMAETDVRGAYIYLLDENSGQICSSPASVGTVPGGGPGPEPDTIRTGVLDNRNTSVRLCVVHPDLGAKCAKKANREDAGGHRQTGTGLAQLDGCPDTDVDAAGCSTNHLDARASYDPHESSTFGSRLPRRYSVSHGATVRTEIRHNGSYGMSYARVGSERKGVKVSLQSDLYGQGAWLTVRPTGPGQPGAGPPMGPYETRTGVLYNDHDALRVCIKGPGIPAKCGEWHRGEAPDYTIPPGDGTKPVDTPPVVDAGPDVRGAEGAPAGLRGSASDDGGTPEVRWSFRPYRGVDKGADCDLRDASAGATSITCTDDGTFEATLTADDGVNPPVTDTALVRLKNVAPELDLDGPKEWDVHRVGDQVSVNAAFTDPGSNDTHTCTVRWDDGRTSSFPAEENGCATSHRYPHAGMNTIEVKVTDDDGGKDDAASMVVVYDPRAGLLTSAGRSADETGFLAVAKYAAADSTRPAGAVKLTLPSRASGDGPRTLLSTKLEWLVITPDGKAVVKGEATGHGFLGYVTSERFRGVVWPLSRGSTPPDDPAYDSAPGESWDVDRARLKPVTTGATVIDSDWIPGLPALPEPLSIGRLTDRLLPDAGAETGDAGAEAGSPARPRSDPAPRGEEPDPAPRSGEPDPAPRVEAPGPAPRTGGEDGPAGLPGVLRSPGAGLLEPLGS